MYSFGVLNHTDMQITNQIQNLSVQEIDVLIAQLEEGYDSLLWNQDNKSKVAKMSALIGKLIDLRCEKLGIKF